MWATVSGTRSYNIVSHNVDSATTETTQAEWMPPPDKGLVGGHSYLSLYGSKAVSCTGLCASLRGFFVVVSTQRTVLWHTLKAERPVWGEQSGTMTILCLLRSPVVAAPGNDFWIAATEQLGRGHAARATIHCSGEQKTVST